MGDLYGNKQGETVACGFVVAATGTASLAGHPFNTVGASRISLGLFAVTILQPVDPTDQASLATAVSAGDTVSSNESNADTDTVKRYVVTAAGGSLIDHGFYYHIDRTFVG